MKQPPTDSPKHPRWFRRGSLAGWLLLPFFLASPVSALDPGKSVFQFHCQNWSRQNGLPTDKINTVTQSEDGYLWLGTQNGLIRFDGLEFKVVPIVLPEAQGQDVRKLISSQFGGIRFAINNGGFGSYDGQTFSALGNNGDLRPGLNATTILEARDGAIWTGADHGLSRWVKGKPEAGFFDETTNGIVLSLCEDPAGRIWLGTAEHGLYYWAEGKFVQLSDDLLQKRNIFALAADAENQIWVGASHGLSCYSQGLPKAIPAFEHEVKALLADRHGVLWIGTTGMGLARYQNGQFTYLRTFDGLGSDNVTSLFEDAEGSLWVGTRDGLSQLTDLKFPIYSTKEGLGMGSSHSVFPSRKGGLWITASSGVSYIDGNTATNYIPESLRPSRYVKFGFEARNGDVYLVDGEKNIDVLSEDRLSARYQNKDWPSALTEDSESVLVAVGTGESLFRIQAGKLSRYQYKEPPPDYYWINNLCVATDGAIWVASNNGVYRIRDGRFKQWSTLDGLSGTEVLWICQDVDGSIWTSSAKGIARIKDDKVKGINSKDGLHEDRVFAIVPDDHGAFWFASGRGIFRVSRQGLNDFADGKTNRIQCEVFEGLESVKFSDRTDQENSGCKTLDGRIWFPSPWGVVMIDPARIPTNRIAPPVHIDRLLANGNEITRSELAIVPAGQDELEFHFTALSFIAPKKMRVRYQMEGYDNDWVETRDRRMALYTNLRPGQYQFRVIAANADGIWNETGDSLKIELRPRYYQTAWFYALCGGLLFAGLAGSYIWRVRHLRRNQQFLQAEVRNRTAELASTNRSLHHEIEEHKGTEVQLKQRTHSLEIEIEERKRMGLEIERVHQQLLQTSRQAGMAEVATDVLHNVGNALNSVNVASTCVADSIRQSKSTQLSKAVALMQEHEADLGAFLTTDPKGKQLPAYLAQLAGHLVQEQAGTLQEIAQLQTHVEHIKDILAMHETIAKVSGVQEVVHLAELVEAAVRMNASALARLDIQVIKEFSDVPTVTTEKHKALQILVNLVSNASHACEAAGRPECTLTIRLTAGIEGVRIVVSDNGVGIAAENLARIFAHGFTTRKDGHGFGLHNGALAARQLGGTLTVHSNGPGQGATFTLELPTDPPRHAIVGSAGREIPNSFQSPIETDIYS